MFIIFKVIVINNKLYVIMTNIMYYIQYKYKILQKNPILYYITYTTCLHIYIKTIKLILHIIISVIKLHINKYYHCNILL